MQNDHASSVIAYSYDAAGRQHGDQTHCYVLDVNGERIVREERDSQRSTPLLERAGETVEAI
ncbi:hypothetical protein [Vreelandella sp. EE7]